MDSMMPSGSDDLGSYVQFFLYRVHKKNHEAMIALERKIIAGWKKHGALQSEFYQLSPHEVVRGFTSFEERISAKEDEEIWVEVQRYRSREQRDEIFDAIRKDMPMLELFGQWYGLVTPGENSTMGDFRRIKI